MNFWLIFLHRVKHSAKSIKKQPSAELGVPVPRINEKI